MKISQTDSRTPLRRARERQGLRLETLASLSGLSLRAVYDAEGGRHEPHRSSKKVLAEALAMNQADLWPPDQAA